jgi:hypothetical protein
MPELVLTYYKGNQKECQAEGYILDLANINKH